VPPPPFFQGDGELALDLLPEDRAGIVGTEGVDSPVGSGIMDAATFHPVHIVVVSVLEVHSSKQKHIPAVDKVNSPLGFFVHDPLE
jgi:hypothetical protein